MNSDFILLKERYHMTWTKILKKIVNVTFLVIVVTIMVLRKTALRFFKKSSSLCAKMFKSLFFPVFFFFQAPKTYDTLERESNPKMLAHSILSHLFLFSLCFYLSFCLSCLLFFSLPSFLNHAVVP